MEILKQTGTEVNYIGNNAVLTNTLYPNMFYAMREMAQISSAKKEKSSGPNSFTRCDFRKLNKDYKFDKFENALMFLSDEREKLARELDKIAKKHKLSRSIKSGFQAEYGLDYKQKGARIMRIGCDCRLSLSIEIPYNRNDRSSAHAFFKSLEDDSQELKKYFLKHLQWCRHCPSNCGYSMTIYGKELKLCHHWTSVLYMQAADITLEQLPYIDKILQYATS